MIANSSDRRVRQGTHGNSKAKMKLKHLIIPMSAALAAVITLLSPATSSAEILYGATVSAKVTAQISTLENVNCHKVGRSNVCDQVQVPDIRKLTFNNLNLLALGGGGSVS